MIKLKIRNDNDEVAYVFGLSKGNIELLQQGRAIKFDMAQIGGEGTMVILYGETEQAIVEDLKKHGVVIPTADITH